MSKFQRMVGIYINEELLQEDYVENEKISMIGDFGLDFQFCDITVPENCVYVIGDNSEKAADSRSFGCVPIDKIQGKVWIRVFPFSSFGKIEFKSYYKDLR